jgi:hypothetical protein
MAKPPRPPAVPATRIRADDLSTITQAAGAVVDTIHLRRHGNRGFWLAT